MIQIGIDTSVLIGLLDAKDVWHGTAVLLKQALQDHRADVAVFDCVLAEAVSTIARRIHEQRRVADLNQFVDCLLNEYSTDDVLWVLPDVPALYKEIIELVRSSQGMLNFNDALIAISCRERGISLIASFDGDFDHVSWLKRVVQPDDLAGLGSVGNDSVALE
jgi:predicted nucleic acid-binding protein